VCEEGTLRRQLASLCERKRHNEAHTALVPWERHNGENSVPGCVRGCAAWCAYSLPGMEENVHHSAHTTVTIGDIWVFLLVLSDRSSVLLVEREQLCAFSPIIRHTLGLRNVKNVSHPR